MGEVLPRIAACIVCATLFSLFSVKMIGAMQQSGYKGGIFLRWLKRRDNMLLNRLCVLSLCLALVSAVAVLCFSFLGTQGALLVSAIPFVGLLFAFLYSDKKYTLKVPVKKTGRFYRLFAVYFLFVSCFCYAFIALLAFLAAWNGSPLYRLIAYVPFAVAPVFLPLLLVASNACEGIFETVRNRKFVKRAGQVLDETEIIRVGVVGSYGKTSVKNILKTLLAQKYTVIETPASFNTPIGIAKTVFSSDFAGKQVLIAEMGARKAGDIAELCSLVKPDYALFTGVAEQHMATFKTVENAFEEKSEIIKSGAYTVCGVDLKDRVQSAFTTLENVEFIQADSVSEIDFYATETQFTLRLGEGKKDSVRIKTKLLGRAAVENILLAATLAKKMGLTADEIAQGVANVQPIAHRLQYYQRGGVHILDDGYNANPRGAKEALEALCRFVGRKCVVTPGIVECGALETQINETLGAELAAANPDTVILVGETLVGAVKTGYLNGGGTQENLFVVPTLERAQPLLLERVGAGDCVLFLNDLPDVY